MYILLNIISLSRKVGLVAMFCLAVSELNASKNPLSNVSSECACQNLSTMSPNAFLKLYFILEKAVVAEPLDESLRNFRKPFLEYLFLSYQDIKAVHSGEAFPLYEVLIQKIAPFMLTPLEEFELQKQIEINSVAWEDIKDFLFFYAPGSEHYNLLQAPEQRQVIDRLYIKYQSKL